MITVAGEALIDLIVDPAGHVDPRPGGGPFNVARAVARLGQPVTFLGRLSDDRFGRILRDKLRSDGVRVAVPEATAEPTTLAVADIDLAGVARYRFYLNGTSAAVLEDARAPGDMTALHIGSLGLISEPIATTLEHLVRALPASVLVMLDPNCRPSAITSKRGYTDRIGRILRRVDVVKTSTEDLGYLMPGAEPGAAAAELLASGPGAVIVTDGAAMVRAYTSAGEVKAEVPPVRVVDTVGAGDAFGGAFLAWWTRRGLGRADVGKPDMVQEATLASVEAAALTCTHRGAEPPWAEELAGKRGWGP
jgi:fructokinase